MKALLGMILCLGSLIGAQKQEPPPYDADLFHKDDQVFSVHGSFLFWRVEEGALDYALKMQHTPPAGGSYAQGKYETASFNGDPGFRVALSFFRAPHYWEIWGEYTRLTTRGQNRASAPSEADLFLTGTWPQIIDTPLLEATSDLHLNYNTGDLLVDRVFNTNPHLRLRLIGGGSVAWMNQNWTIQYSNAENQTSQINNKWKFIGGGLKIGTMIDWFCGWDIYLTGRSTFGSFLGSYENISKQQASTVSELVRNAHYSDVRTAFTIQGMFGPSWQKNFTNSRMEIFAGYEINSWFNLQEIYRSSLSESPSDARQTWINSSALTLQGLTARMTFDF